VSEQLYRELKANGVESLELPTQNLVLVGAFSRKEQRVTKQVYLILNFGGVLVDQIFLVSAQLLTTMLIGYDNLSGCSLVDYVRKETKVLFILCNRLAGKQNLEIIAVVKTA
jgi:hypothetical protein